MRAARLFLACLTLAALTAWVLLHPSPSPLSAPAASATSAPARPLVLAGHASTFGLASALAEGTAIDVAWAWPEGATWSDQHDVPVTPRAAQAAAVVTLRQAAPEDALYAAARAANLSVVEIDATLAADQRTSVVRLREGTPGDFAPVAPLSLGNAVRMAEVVARDFARLSPPDEARIGENLRRVKERLFRLRAGAEARLAEVIDADVLLLSPVFAAFVEDLGLFVRPSAEPGVRVALAAYPPPPEQAAALAEAGVAVAELDALSGMPEGADHYFRVLERNVAALTDVLARP